MLRMLTWLPKRLLVRFDVRFNLVQLFAPIQGCSTSFLRLNCAADHRGDGCAGCGSDMDSPLLRHLSSMSLLFPRHRSSLSDLKGP